VYRQLRLKGKCNVFKTFNGVGLFEFIESIIIVSLVMAIAARRGSSQEARTLQKENRRLRNILADLMISNTHIKDTR
jgi:hypothetical protein